jgi:uncharacterized protein YaeQ
MALNATIHKAQLQIADMDRSVYASPALTLARHPSETDERLMMRLLAYALYVPADERDGALEPAKGLSDTSEPDLWQRDLTGDIVHWIEVGQPDERRIAKAAGRARQVSVLAYAASTPIWWNGLKAQVERMCRVQVWAVPAEASRELSRLAQRSMKLQVTVQDGHVWVGDETRSVELVPQRLTPQPG